MPFDERREDFAEGDVSRAQQHEEVEEQVGRLADQRLVVRGHRRERDFDAFLAHFLGYPRQPPGEQARRVTALGGRLRAGRDDLLEAAQEAAADWPQRSVFRPIEAARRPRVTDRTPRAREHEDGVGVAVVTELDEVERVARRLALLPEPLPRATEKHHPAAFLGRLDGGAAHVAEHQHAPIVGVLHDGRHEPVALRKVEPSSEAHGRTSMPAARSARLRSGMAIVPP